MMQLSIEQGGVYDWPLVIRMLSEKPDYIAMTSDRSAMKRLPESKVLYVPWYPKHRLYICTRKQALQTVKASMAFVQKWKEIWGSGQSG